MSTATFACQQCGAGLAFEGVRATTCPYCASGNVVERPATAGQPEPRFVIGFAHDAARARAVLKKWLGSRTLFADSRLAHARVEDVRGIYLPAYLYSARTATEYTASIGEHYTETEEYETTDAQGNKKTEKRSVTRTEYRPLSGRHVGYVTDVVVSASKGLPNRELAAVEPFDMRALRHYEPAVIAGWIAEEFSRDPAACMQDSRSEATDEVGMRLKRHMPGDSHSDLEWRTRVAWESFDPVLLPVWVFAVRYRDDKPPLRVVINGQTEKAGGKVPLATWKIVVASVVLAAVIAAIIWVVRS